MIWVIFQYDDPKKVYSFIYSLSNPSYFTFLERSMTRFSQRTYCCKGSINSLREMTIASHFVVRIVSLFHTKDKYQREGAARGRFRVECHQSRKRFAFAYRCSSPVDTLSAKSLTYIPSHSSLHAESFNLIRLSETKFQYKARLVCNNCSSIVIYCELSPHGAHLRTCLNQYY